MRSVIRLQGDTRILNMSSLLKCSYVSIRLCEFNTVIEQAFQKERLELGAGFRY